MTVLIGAYSDDRRDIVLVADRRSVPNAYGEAMGVKPVEDVVKTLKLNNKCAIGFAGSVPLENLFLSQLLEVPKVAMEQDPIASLVGSEGSWHFLTYESVIASARSLLPFIVSVTNPPDEVWLGMIIGGYDEYGLPRLTFCQWYGGWSENSYNTGAAFFAPAETNEEREQIGSMLEAPGVLLDERLKNAVRYCSERYPSVSDRYIARRLSKGFSAEPGTA